MIMVIVVSHFEFLEPLNGFGSFYTIYLHNATFAVDFFFLPSGFGMMLGSISRTRIEEMKFPKISDCLAYGIKHIRKIYPVYILTIFFGVCAEAVDAIYKSNFTFNFILREIVKIIVNIPVLQSATGMSFFILAYNGVTWFLSALFCIYLISPILIFILRKFSKSYFGDLLFLLINAFFIVALAYFFGKIETIFHGIKQIPNVDNLVYVSPYRRVFYVLTGMNLATIFTRLKNDNIKISKKIANVMKIVLSSLVLAYFFMRNSLPNTQFYYKYLIDLFLCACFILIFSFDEGCISNYLKKPMMQKLGNMAMYIFLIHYPIRRYFSWFIDKFFGWTELSSLLFIIFILAMTFVLSLLFYNNEKSLTGKIKGITIK